MIYKNIVNSVTLVILICSVLFSQENNNKIIVGTKIAEPFVMENKNGELTGISLELWEKITQDLNIEYEIKKYDLEGLINAVANKEVDIAVSPLTITSEREEIFDFTHAYYSTGLSIAVSNEARGSLISIIKNFLSIPFLTVLLFVVITLFLVGFLVWLFERKKNKEEFGDGLTKGLGSSFWWAAVTMTTVGYGDKTPRTIGGRIVALIWMFAGLVMISSFTAAIASSLTVEQLEFDINVLSDIKGIRVGTVNGSSSEGYLNQNGVSFITTANVKDGIELIRNDKLDAFVYDAPILKYYIKSQNISNEVKILPLILNPINYGFALPTGSLLREPLNTTLLKIIDKKEWETLINSYLGF